MRKLFLSVLVLLVLFQSCSTEDDKNDKNMVASPEDYEFTRNGKSTVNFSKQTTTIRMAEEIIAALLDPTELEASIDGMFEHVQGVDNFDNPDLNVSDISVRSKIAASLDYFSLNTEDANAIKADLDTWIKAQVDDVFPNWDTDAVSGAPGRIQEAGGGSLRYVNAKGLEYNQAVIKSMIGALMVDQILNHYLSPTVLDAATNVADNNSVSVVPGQYYTGMEHSWDQAYGYVYGLNADATNPNLDLGADSFLNKYIGRQEGDPDFSGVADDIYQAFKLGRAAIVAKNYGVRDEQIEIIREKISEIIGVRAVYYLQQAKLFLVTDKAAAFHDLSEGFGFIYSLQFTRKPGTSEPYFTKAEVDSFIATLTQDNGFWDITTETLDVMSNDIAARFKFTVEQAGS